MSDEDEVDAPPEADDSSVIRTLREKAKGTDAATARAEAAERELAFAKAGIDTDDPRQGYFVRGYDGPIDAGAIKAAATDAGFLGAPLQGEIVQPGITADEQAQLQRMAQASASGNSDSPPPDIYKDMAGKSPEQIAELLRSAGGDVAYDGPQGSFTNR